MGSKTGPMTRTVDAWNSKSCVAVGGDRTILPVTTMAQPMLKCSAMESCSNVSVL